MNYIDTHFHLDLWNNPKDLLYTLERERIYTIAVTNSPSVFRYTYDMTKNKKYVRAALGFHPELVTKRKREINSFLEQIELTRYIGEVGLDYANAGFNDRKVQMKIFEKIIETCSKYNDKLLTIHSRRAHQDVIEIIGENFPNKVILHWYSGSLKELQKAIYYGFYFSFNFAMILSEKGQKIISQIPLNRLLTESDGPFISYKNEKCSPLRIKKLIESLAKIININEADFMKIVFDNLKFILGVNNTELNTLK